MLSQGKFRKFWSPHAPLDAPGRADNPLRRILNYASKHFLSHVPIIYVLTVSVHRLHGHHCTRKVTGYACLHVCL